MTEQDKIISLYEQLVAELKELVAMKNEEIARLKEEVKSLKLKGVDLPPLIPHQPYKSESWISPPNTDPFKEWWCGDPLMPETTCEGTTGNPLTDIESVAENHEGVAAGPDFVDNKVSQLIPELKPTILSKNKNK